MKQHVYLTTLVGVNLVLQAIIQWGIVFLQGVGVETDAYTASLTIPTFILNTTISSLVPVLLPFFTNKTELELREKGWRLIVFFVIFFGILSLILSLTCEIWTRWLLPGFSTELLNLTVYMTRIQLLGFVFSPLLFVVWTLHSVKENFYWIETSGIIANVIALIFSFVLFPYIGVISIVWGSIIRILLSFVFLFPILGKYRKYPNGNIFLKEVGKKLAPVIGGNLYYKTDTIIDRYLLSSTLSGNMTLFTLGQQLYNIVIQVVSKVFINTIQPVLSRFWLDGEKKMFNHVFFRRLFLLIIITITLFLIYLIIGKYLFNILLIFNKINKLQIDALHLIMIALCGFWTFGVLGGYTSNTFYTVGNTQIPTLLSLVNFTIFIPYKLWFYHHYGVWGLGVAVSIHYGMGFFSMLYFLNRKRYIYNPFSINIA